MVEQVWKFSPVRGLDRLVLLGLADRANESERGESWPSAQTLADDLDLSLRTVQRSLQRLRDDGHIVPISGMRGGNSTTVRYRFAVRLLLSNKANSPATLAGSAPPQDVSAPPNMVPSPATLAEEPSAEPERGTTCPDGYASRRECPWCRRDDERWGPKPEPIDWLSLMRRNGQAS